jgi:hypothetical protein
VGRTLSAFLGAWVVARYRRQSASSRGCWETSVVWQPDELKEDLTVRRHETTTDAGQLIALVGVAYGAAGQVCGVGLPTDADRQGPPPLTVAAEVAGKTK